MNPLFYMIPISLVAAIVMAFLIMDFDYRLATMIVKIIFCIQTKIKNKKNSGNNGSDYETPHSNISNRLPYYNEFLPRYVQPISLLITLISRYTRIIQNRKLGLQK